MLGLEFKYLNGTRNGTRCAAMMSRLQTWARTTGRPQQSKVARLNEIRFNERRFAR